MKTDLHLHSNYSSDSRITPEEVIDQAIIKKIEVIAITDHADFAAGDSRFEPTAYLKHLRTLSDRQTAITVLCGVELGIQAEHARQCNNFLNGQNFDFIIGSMHRSNERDFYNGEFFTEKTAEQCWETYFRETLRAVKACSNFDVMGHVDIIRRYNITRNTLPPAAVLPLVDELFLWLIDNGKGIELNTSGLRYGLDSVHPTKPMLQRYKDLGGKIVTIGSDSHRIENIGENFSLAIDMLKSCGFTHHAWFKNRQVQFAEL